MIDSKAALLSILKTMRPGPGYWSTDHIDMYDIGLRNLPDKHCDAVAVAVLAKFDDRPSAKQIMDIYAELSEKDQPETVTDVLGSLRELVGKYGENGARHPQFPERWPRITSLGPPPELSVMDLAVQKTIKAFGGWVDFARSFDWSNPSDRAQFREMYKAVTLTASDAALQQIKLEYRAGQRPALTSVTDETSAENSESSNTGFSRVEASSFLQLAASRAAS